VKHVIIFFGKLTNTGLATVFIFPRRLQSVKHMHTMQCLQGKNVMRQPAAQQLVPASHPALPRVAGIARAAATAPTPTPAPPSSSGLTNNGATMNWHLQKLKHVVDSGDFNRAAVDVVFKEALKMEKVRPHSKESRVLDGFIMSTLFYEPSTRTRLSFESAMTKLGGAVLSTESAGEYSSAAKGETLEGAEVAARTAPRHPGRGTLHARVMSSADASPPWLFPATTQGQLSAALSVPRLLNARPSPCKHQGSPSRRTGLKSN
jgi:hypothetical protein